MPNALQRREVLPQPVGVARAELQRLRQEQFLAENLVGFEASAQFLEQDAFVGGVLIDEHQSARVFHQHVQAGSSTPRILNCDGLGRLIRLTCHGGSELIAGAGAGSVRSALLSRVLDR